MCHVAALWHSGISEGDRHNINTLRLVLHENGNWIKYFFNTVSNRREVLWWSQTQATASCHGGKRGTRVMLQDNGRPAIYTDDSDEPLWVASGHIDKPFCCNTNSLTPC